MPPHLKLTVLAKQGFEERDLSAADIDMSELMASLTLDADELPEIAGELNRRAPIEPYRRKLGFMAERLRRTRATPWRAANARTRLGSRSHAATSRTPRTDRNASACQSAM